MPGLRQGMEAYGVRAFAEALEVIPFTLAENAGLNAIEIVTELRNRHAQGDASAGINVRKVTPARPGTASCAWCWNCPGTISQTS